MFLKSVVAKDADSVAIDAIVKEVGCRVDRAKANNSITAIGALEEVYFGFADRRSDADGKATATANPALLKATLAVIGNAWGGTADSLHGHIISGVGRLLAARQRAMEVGDLVHKLSTYPGGPTALCGAASGRRSVTGGKVGGAMAEVCLDLYNKGRRVGKLEPLR